MRVLCVVTNLKWPFHNIIHFGIILNTFSCQHVFGIGPVLISSERKKFYEVFRLNRIHGPEFIVLYSYSRRTIRVLVYVCSVRIIMDDVIHMIDDQMLWQQYWNIDAFNSTKCLFILRVNAQNWWYKRMDIQREKAVSLGTTTSSISLQSFSSISYGIFNMFGQWTYEKTGIQITT